jgi:hypothetical protein
MVMKTAILGDEAAVRARLRQYAEVGIDILMLHPLGAEVEDRLDVLGRATELVAQESSAS